MEALTLDLPGEVFVLTVFEILAHTTDVVPNVLTSEFAVAQQNPA
jgi:hypothetical protein